MRRLRSTNGIRKLVRETNLCGSDLIQPIFIIEGKNKRQRITSMPGIDRLSIDMAIKEVRSLTKNGIGAVALFPQIEKKKKTIQATEAHNDDGLIQRAIREIKNKVPDSVIIRGSKVLLDSIYFVETETYYEEDVFKSISKKVNLKPIQGVNFSKGKVDIELSVSRYSEKELNIPIELINQPKGIKVKLFPANSKIRATIPMKIIGNVGISDFRLIADYNKILDGQTQKLELYVQKKPAGVKQIILEPKEVNYLIRK